MFRSRWDDDNKEILNTTPTDNKGQAWKLRKRTVAWHSWEGDIQETINFSPLLLSTTIEVSMYSPVVENFNLSN